jgi:hypothetical protein
MPFYDPSLEVLEQRVLRDFQSVPPHVEFKMPALSTNGLMTMVPYQSGEFGFDPTSVKPLYNMPYSMLFTTPPEQSLSIVLDAQNTFNPVRSEMNNYASYAAECKPITSEPTQGPDSGNVFTTGVDNLMRAIQAKKAISHQPLEREV